MVNGHSSPEPYVVIRAPAVLDRLQHRNWIRARCEDLSKEGYTFFRASFPDDRPNELWLEGWVERPAEQGPCPWQEGGACYAGINPADRPRHDPVREPSDIPVQQGVGTVAEQPAAPDTPDHPPVRPDSRVEVLGSDVCLLDGSPLRPYNPHTRKLKDGQQTSYVRMSDARLASTAPVRPYQRMTRHLRCTTLTEMHDKMAQTIARDPSFYKALFCAHCRAHFKIGADGEFIWKASDQKVGT